MARNVDSIFHTVFRTTASILRKCAGYKTTIVVVRVDLSYSFDTIISSLLIRTILLCLNANYVTD